MLKHSFIKFFNRENLHKHSLLIKDYAKTLILFLAVFLKLITGILIVVFSFVKVCLVFCYIALKLSLLHILKHFLLLFNSFKEKTSFIFVGVLGASYLTILKLMFLVKGLFFALFIFFKVILITLLIHVPLFIAKSVVYFSKSGGVLFVKLLYFIKATLHKTAILMLKTPSYIKYILLAFKLVLSYLYIRKKHKAFIWRTFKQIGSFLKSFTALMLKALKSTIMLLLEVIKLPFYVLRFIAFVIKDAFYFCKNIKLSDFKRFLILIRVIFIKIILFLVKEIKIILTKVKSMVFISYLVISAVLGKKFVEKKKESLFTRLLHLAFTVLVLVVGILAFYKQPSNFLKYSAKWQDSFSFLAVGSVASHAYENISVLSKTRHYTKNIEIKDGDALGLILVDNNIASADIAKIVSALNEIFSVEKVRVGWVLKLQLSSSLLYGGYNKLEKMHLPIDNSYNVVVSRNVNTDDYSILKEERVLSRHYLRKNIVVQTSLYEDAVKNNISPAIISQAIKILSWDIDFQREVGKGNELEIVYSCMFDQYDTELFCEDLVFLDFSSPNRHVNMFKYKSNYYLKDGTSARKSLLRTPIDGARLSSKFGPRRHPVLGYTKMHKGIDFAARTGTPIYAAGDGTVRVSGWSDTFGYNVMIKHNASVETRYAHMNKIHPNARTNKRVKQGDIIGYVGTTGRSTGPHLHYEMIVLGKQVNPLTISLPANDKIAGDDLGYFLDYVNNINHVRLKMPFSGKMNKQEFESFVPFDSFHAENNENKTENSPL